MASRRVYPGGFLWPRKKTAGINLAARAGRYAFLYVSALSEMSLRHQAPLKRMFLTPV
jgi:hypothetical protein